MGAESPPYVFMPTPFDPTPKFHLHQQQRKQALKEYAASAQRAADAVRRQAGQPAHAADKNNKPLNPPPKVLSGDLLGTGQTPPPRDRARGLWSEEAVAWTREHWLAGRTADEEAALT